MCAVSCFAMRDSARAHVFLQRCLCRLFTLAQSLCLCRWTNAHLPLLVDAQESMGIAPCLHVCRTCVSKTIKVVPFFIVCLLRWARTRPLRARHTSSWASATALTRSCGAPLRTSSCPSPTTLTQQRRASAGGWLAAVSFVLCFFPAGFVVSGTGFWAHLHPL
jgi:hypothetical protein